LRTFSRVLSNLADLASESPLSSGSHPSTLTPTSPDPQLLSLIEAMTAQAQAQQTTIRAMMAETRELVVTLAQGRPQEQTTRTFPPVTGERGLTMSDYDNDVTFPLPAGIEAQLSREEQEAEYLRRLETEHSDLAEQLAQERLRLANLAADVQGPSAP
jgi:hypothetical protein